MTATAIFIEEIPDNPVASTPDSASNVRRMYLEDAKASLAHEPAPEFEEARVSMTSRASRGLGLEDSTVGIGKT
jgi:hypothetical protein